MLIHQKYRLLRKKQNGEDIINRSAWSGKLSKYSVSRDKDEIEINEYLDSQTLANSATENQQEKQELVNMVYDDVSFVRKAMDYKVELDCMRIASSGVQTFPEKIEGDMASQPRT